MGPYWILAPSQEYDLSSAVFWRECNELTVEDSWMKAVFAYSRSSWPIAKKGTAIRNAVSPTAGDSSPEDLIVLMNSQRRLMTFIRQKADESGSWWCRGSATSADSWAMPSTDQGSLQTNSADSWAMPSTDQGSLREPVKDQRLRRSAESTTPIDRKICAILAARPNK